MTRSLVTISFLAITAWLLLAGCQARNPDLPEQVQAGLGSAPPETRASSSPAELPDTSIYHLQGQWLDQHGETLTLSDLRGRPQVLAMVYSRCRGACPRIIADIQSVEASLGKEPGEVGYLLVSMDPEVDSPQRLQALAQEYNLGERWRLLRAPSEQVKELAAVLGVKYRKVNETEFAHSNTITILDGAGTVVHQKQELGADVDASSQAVRDLLAKPKACCSGEKHP